MKKEITTIMVRQMVAEWIADDGTRFDREYDCREYEEYLFLSMLDSSPDVEAWEHNEDNYPPFTGESINDDNAFWWYKPLNENGILLLRKVFRSLDFKMEYIGKWLCIERCDFDEWLTTLDDSIAYAKKVLDLFGYELSVKPKEV